MYSGVIKNRIVYCCHPVVVVAKSGVAASFMQVDDAKRFLAHRGFGFGDIYQHNGSDWDKIEVDPIQVLDSIAHNTS
ncbi:MAG: hypothetical protein ACO34E_15865 [Limisphaerales bacterium]|jgi:hypothetical protein